MTLTVNRVNAACNPLKLQDAFRPKLFVNPISSYTNKLTQGQAKELEWYLRENQFEPRTVPYARFAGAKRDVNVVFYESGKLVVQGKGTQEFVEFVLEPLILKEAKLGYEE